MGKDTPSLITPPYKTLLEVGKKHNIDVSKQLEEYYKKQKEVNKEIENDLISTSILGSQYNG